MVTDDPGTGGMAQQRYENALLLFDEFVQAAVRHPDAAALRGLERRFAEHLLIQPSYWSQIKARTRQIGERLARQFEQRCRKPMGWMDVPHHGQVAQVRPSDEPLAPAPPPSTPQDDDERFIVGLVLSYYRRHPQRARTRLLDLLGEVLTPPAPQPRQPEPGPAAGPASPPAAAPAPADEASELLRRSLQGVAPLKRRR